MGQKQYRACIFDLDGTLANTLSSIAYFGNGTLETFHLPPIPTEQYRYLVGNGADTLMRRMLAAVHAELTEQEFLRFRAEYDRRYESEPMKLVSSYPGLQELLTVWKRQGIHIAVLSNKPDNMTKYIVRQLYGDLPELVQGQREGVPKKPDPTAVLQLAEALNVLPEQVLYIGDSGVDMDTGNNAGMDTCGVLWGFRDREELLEHGAKYLVSTAEELGRLVAGK